MYLFTAEKAYAHWCRMMRIQTLAAEAQKEFPHKRGLGKITISCVDFVDGWFRENVHTTLK